MTLTSAIVTGQESGLDDRQFLRRLRELMRDIPQAADVQASGLGIAVRYNLNVRPINDDDYFQVLVNNALVQVIETPDPAPGQVFVDFDTGRLIFGTPPPAGTNNITVFMNQVKWRDSVLLEAMRDGMRMMYPKLCLNAMDDSISLVTNVWDYDLPPVFFNPDARIVDVGVREIPAATNRFIPLSGWERIGLDKIRIPASQAFTPGATVQILYDAPYASLSAMEPKYQMLPLWYAGGMLMTFEDQKRARIDTQNVTTEDQANPVGAQGSAGAGLLRQFYTSLDRLARPRRAIRPQFTTDR